MIYVLRGIEACNTMRKAQTWSGEHKVTCDFHDYEAVGIDREHLRRWRTGHGWQTVPDRADTAFRKPDEAQKADLDEAEATELVLARPPMTRHPALELSGRTLVGPEPGIYAAALTQTGDRMSIAWVLFIPTCFALNLAPGSNDLLSLNNAAQHGFTTASLIGGGRLLVFAGMPTPAAPRLALVLHTSAWLLPVIKLLGATYLLWLAPQL